MHSWEGDLHNCTPERYVNGDQVESRRRDCSSIVFRFLPSDKQVTISTISIASQKTTRRTGVRQSGPWHQSCNPGIMSFCLSRFYNFFLVLEQAIVSRDLEAAYGIVSQWRQSLTRTEASLLLQYRNGHGQKAIDLAVGTGDRDRDPAFENLLDRQSSAMATFEADSLEDETGPADAKKAKVDRSSSHHSVLGDVESSAGGMGIMCLSVTDRAGKCLHAPESQTVAPLRLDLLESFPTGERRKGGVLMERLLRQKTFSAAAKYEGPSDGYGRPHGHGRMISVTGDVLYEGGFHEGLRNGQGKFTHPGGNTYEGEIRDGEEHGQGKWTYMNGVVYEGEWRDGKEHGQGKSTYPGGFVYQGEWRDGKEHGQGKFTYPGGFVYEGEWRDGKEHGQGKFIYADKFVYEGEWRGGKEHGQGKLTHADGRVYEGDWRDGGPHGQGKYTSSDGRVKEGEWREGEPYSVREVARAPS